MPMILIFAGIIFFVAAMRDKQSDLVALLKNDFTGPDNFFYWFLALFVIGAIGYYKPLKPLSGAFMTLIILVLFLSHSGFFSQFMSQIGATETPSNQDSSQFVGNPVQALGRIVSELKGVADL